jgi:glycerophosphoryl diester phosphodiesterase
VARGALVDGAAGWHTRLALGLLTRPDAVHPEHVLVTPERVAAWKRLGLAVATWTVDDPDEAERCLACGVDAVITNVPDVVRPVVERWASSR